MSFWSVAAPLATLAASVYGTPAAGAAVGAATGAMAAKERRSQLMDRQQQTADAAATAIGASYGRTNGVGTIPQVEYAGGTEAGDTATGAFGGGLQGFSLGVQNDQYNRWKAAQVANAPYGPQNWNENVDWLKVPSTRSASFYDSRFSA